MTPKQMYDEFRSYLDLETDTWVGGDEIWRKLHNAQQELIRLVNRLNTSYYIQDASISVVKGTALYTLPLNCRRGSRLVFTEDVDDYLEVTPAHMVDKLDFDAPGLISLVRDRAFTLQRGKIRIMPTPTGNDTLKVWYLPHFGNMLQGFAAAGGSSTLVSFAGDPDYTLNYGNVDPRDDYYNNMELLIVGGTNIGAFKEVTDYTGGSTRSLSIAAESWDSTPDTTTEFCLLCPLLEDFHQMVPVRAAMDGAIKNKNRVRELKDQYRVMKDDLLAWAQERQVGQMEDTAFDDGEF